MSDFFATLARLDDPDWVIARVEERRLAAAQDAADRRAHEDEVADGLISDPYYEPFDWAEED